jgi:hypothetical protein
LQRRSKQTAFILISIVLIAAISACAQVGGALPSVRQSDAGGSVTQADRTSCAAIGTSDLLSPTEGVWYQTHCLPASAFPQGVATTSCNRPTVAAIEFRQVAPGLFVFRQSESSPAYLWYATTPNCLDLVSGRVVTAVCVDRAISFQSDLRLSCLSHGGILVRINGN